MHRRHHQSLSTMGGTGQEPAVEEPDVHPEVWSIRKRCRSPGGGHPADAAPPGPDPDVGGPKRRRLGAQSAPAPDVEGAPKHHLGPPDPDVGMRVGLRPPPEVVGADVPHLALSEADGGAPLPLSPHREGSREPDVGGAENGGRVLVVDSDTDAEDEGPHPDVGAPPKGRGGLEDSDTDVEREPCPPPLGTPRDGHPLLVVVESDTDVEEDASDPDVWPPKPPRALPRRPDVGLESPPPAKLQGLLGDSDTDVEEAEESPEVGRLEGQMLRRTERVLVMETPKPDVGEPQGVHADTDGEDEDLTQCFLHPRSPPMVVLESPVPDVGAMPPNAAVSPPSSDTDAGEVAPTPDVWDPRFQAFPHPDVVGSGAETAANSWKTAPKSRSNGGMVPTRNGVSPDPHVEAAQPDVEAPSPDVVAPSPDVRALSPDVKAPDPDVSVTNPDVRAPNTDVRASSPDVRAPNPDVRAPSPDVKAPNPDVKAQNLHVSAPYPAMVAPDPDVGAQGHSGKTLAPLPAVPMDASTPKSQHLDSSSGVTSGADGTESDSDDVDLFLEPTQSFLPPADKGSPQGWDPEEPTQLFCPPQEEEKEEPPQDPPQATVTPPKEGTKEEGPRRSQRLARSQGGGAKGGVASLDPAPLRRSARLLARPAAEPRPPPSKPRPRRAGTGQSRRSAQEKEEEPIEGEAPQLRPRRSIGSSPLKVLFTGVVASEAMEVALRSLGGSVATSVFDCTHLVTDRVRRTVKFLCAVARGIPVVTPEWLHKSATSGRILATGPFLVQDRQQERHFGFNLAQALQRARRHPLLQGYEIHVTPSVRPEPEHMKDIITCSGGTFLPTMPSSYRPRRVVVSCPADSWCWAPALSSRLPLASPELLLTGLLRQRLQLQPFLLPPPTDPPPPRNRGPPNTRRRPVGPPQ